MKALRPKQADWSKPFKLLLKKEDFKKIDPEPDSIVTRGKKDKSKEKIKEQIIKPRIEIVVPPPRNHNSSGIPLNYVRITSNLNLPKPDTYELCEVDYKFIEAYREKYLFGTKKVLTEELLEKCFVEIELIAGKDISTLPKTLKAKFKAILEKQLDVMSAMDNLDELVDLIYNRWRSRR